MQHRTSKWAGPIKKTLLLHIRLDIEEILVRLCILTIINKYLFCAINSLPFLLFNGWMAIFKKYRNCNPSKYWCLECNGQIKSLVWTSYARYGQSVSTLCYQPQVPKIVTIPWEPQYNSHYPWIQLNNLAGCIKMFTKRNVMWPLLKGIILSLSVLNENASPTNVQ